MLVTYQQLDVARKENTLHGFLIETVDAFISDVRTPMLEKLEVYCGRNRFVEKHYRSIKVDTGQKIELPPLVPVKNNLFGRQVNRFINSLLFNNVQFDGVEKMGIEFHNRLKRGTRFAAIKIRLCPPPLAKPSGQ